MVEGVSLVLSNKNKKVAGEGSRRKGRSITDAISAGEYKVQEKLRVPERMAHYLDWAAAKYPKAYTPYNFVLKAIMGFEKTPRLGSEDVDRLRGKITRTREILQELYGRDLDTQPGVGVRATVDDADTTTVALPKKVKRLAAASNSVKKTMDLIDPKKLPDTAEMAPWKKWLTTDVKTIVKTLSAPDFASRMLPPGVLDKTDKGGDGGE